MHIHLSCAAADFRFHSNWSEWIEFEMLHHWTTGAAKAINNMRNISTQHTGCWMQKRAAKLLDRGVSNSFRTIQISREPMPTHLPTYTWSLHIHTYMDEKNPMRFEWIESFPFESNEGRKKQRKLARNHIFHSTKINSLNWCRWKIQTGPFVPFVSEIALPTHNEYKQWTGKKTKNEI